MTRNQLPEGVGKKIVEALKRQAEADISPIEESSVSMGNSLPLTEIEDLPELEPLVDVNGSAEDMIVEEEPLTVSEGVYKIKEEAASKTFMEQAIMSEQPKIQPIQQPQYASVSLNQEKLQQAIMKSANSKLAIPTNVAILRNLINTLPVGVTKQTGAQIIRQTLEAMGIPMNSILKEAQVFQEELNSSTRECMIKIQEYKTQIMQLETSVQEYQQNITQVNDIVSMFLLTDK